jgi:hypothetical protein
MKVLTPEFEQKLNEITNLSIKINNGDAQAIIDLMHAHIKEIEQRFHEADEHWAIETADLIILCYELLLMENKDIDDVFNRCIPRFDVKLKRLAENVS